MESSFQMPNRWSVFYNDVIKNDEPQLSLKNISGIISEIIKTINLVKSEVIKNNFENEQEEIDFFKNIKPRFHSLLLYWTTVYSIELNKPVGSQEMIETYFKGYLQTLCQYFFGHMDFYSYWRSDQSHMDHQYFLRINAHEVDRDPVFSTSHDYLVTKILSNDMLQVYLDNTLANRESSALKKATSLKWTGSKAGMVELIYALQSGGVYNNGSAEIREIASQFEKLFGVELGNYYHVFNEIRLRKKSRSQLLDHLKEKLVGKMDEMDEK